MPLFLTGCKIYTIPKENFKVEEVITGIKEDKNEAYVKANTWMVDKFDNPKSVIEFTDKEEGVIIGKYFMLGQVPAEFGLVELIDIYAKIDIRIKDNSAKILIIPFKDIQSQDKSAGSKLNTITEFQLLIADFKNYMLKETTDW